MACPVRLGTATLQLGTATLQLGTATLQLGTATLQLGTATLQAVLGRSAWRCLACTVLTRAFACRAPAPTYSLFLVDHRCWVVDYRSTGNGWPATPKQCSEVRPCPAPEMIRPLGSLGDLPMFANLDRCCSALQCDCGSHIRRCKRGRQQGSRWARPGAPTDSPGGYTWTTESTTRQGAPRLSGTHARALSLS